MKLSHCPTHAMVLDAAREEMATTKRFMKESVMAATPFPRKVWELIQWPFIREMIEQELGGEPLQPVATPTTTGNGHAWDPEIHAGEVLARCPQPYRRLRTPFRRSAGSCPCLCPAPLQHGSWLGSVDRSLAERLPAPGCD